MALKACRSPLKNRLETFKLYYTVYIYSIIEAIKWTIFARQFPRDQIALSGMGVISPVDG
jgi:hypothetical protein